MRAFKEGQRVVVDEPSLHPDLRNKVGTVKRCRMADSGAWVRMDDPLPDGVGSFPAGDPRERDVLLYPQECMPASGQ